MVTGCFQLFFANNVKHYNANNMGIGFVGSVAYYFEKQLRTAAQKEDSLIIKIMKEPL
jgi:hypothetical protein